MVDTHTGVAPQLDGYDPTNPMEFVNPFPSWARARVEAPVFFDETLGYWQVTRYEDIATAARNTKAFSSEGFFSTVHIFEENRDLIPKGLAIWTPALVNADPPAHTEVRKVSDPAFRKSRISDPRRLDPRAGQRADRQVSSMTVRPNSSRTSAFRSR